MALILLLFSSLAFAHDPSLTKFVNASAKPSIMAQKYGENNYLDLAKIDMQQAIQAARKVSTGKLIESSLEKKNDFLVYRVAFSERNKRVVRVYIDAGNGAFLEKETTQR